MEQGKRELTLSLEKLQEQERIIAQSNKELGELRGKLQSISVLRLNILEEVKNPLKTK